MYTAFLAIYMIARTIVGKMIISVVGGRIIIIPNKRVRGESHDNKAPLTYNTVSGPERIKATSRTILPDGVNQHTYLPPEERTYVEGRKWTIV